MQGAWEPRSHMLHCHRCSVTQSCLNPCDPIDCSTPRLSCPSLSPRSCSNSCPLSQWCYPTILSSIVPSSAFNLSQNQSLFQRVGFLHQMVRVLEFQFQHQPSSEYSGLIFFRIDWFDLLAVQGTFKSLCQHHSSKAWILWCSALFIVQSHIHTWLLEKP